MGSQSRPGSRVLLRPDGILVSREIRTTEAHTTETAESDFETISAIAGSERRPALWDVRGMARPGPGAWAVLIEQVSDFVFMLAILIDPDENNLGSFPSAINSLLIPVRIFTSEDEAIDWLKPFAGTSQV